MAIVIDEYLRALRENPNDLEVVAAMDRALSHGQDWATLTLALPDAANGLTDAAHRARFLLRAAWVAQEYNQDAEHARALFMQVVSLDLPDDSLVGAFQMAFSPDQDWSGLTRALVLFCDYASSDATRARLLYAAGRAFETRLFDKAQAIAAYQKAFRLDPHFTDSLHAARSIYAQEEQWGTVVKLFQVELKIPREDRVRARLLREMAHVQVARLGDSATALENFKQSLLLDPSQSSVREQIATLGGDVPELEPEILGAEPEVAAAEPVSEPEEEAAAELEEEAAAEPEEEAAAEPEVEAASEPEVEAASEPEVEAAAEPEVEAAAEPEVEAAAEPEVEAAAEPEVEAAAEPEVEAAAEPEEEAAAETEVEAAAETEEEAAAEPEVEAAAEPELEAAAEPEVEAAAEPEVEAAAEPELEAASEPEVEAAAEPEVEAAAEPEVEAAAEPEVEAAVEAPVSEPSPAAGASAPVSAVAARTSALIVDGAASYLGADESARDWVLGLVELAPTQSGDTALKTWSIAIEFGRKLGFGATELTSWALDAVRGSQDGMAAVQALMPALYGAAEVWRATAAQLDVECEGDQVLTSAAYAVHFYALSDGARASELAPQAGSVAALEQTCASFAVKGNWRKTQTGLQEALAGRFGGEAETESYRAQTWIAMGLGSEEKAIDSLRRVVRARKSDEQASSLLRAIFLRGEKWNELATLLKTDAAAVSNQEPMRKALMLRELIHVYRDQLQQDLMVVSTYQALLEVQPKDVVTIDLLASKLRDLSRFPDLVEVLKKKADVTEDASARIGILEEVARLYVEKFNNQAEAIKAYEEILSLDSSRQSALVALEDAYDKRREWDKLIEVKRRLMEQTYDVARQAALMREAAEIAATRKRDIPGSVLLWNEVLSIAPGDLTALTALEQIYEREKQFEPLADVLQQRVDLVSDTKDRAAALLKLGMISGDKLGRTQQALSAWEQLLLLEPENFRARDAVRKGYMELERWDDLESFYARDNQWAEYVRQVESHAGSVSADSLKIDLLQRASRVWEDHLGDAGRAVKNLEKILTIDADNAGAARRLLPTYRERGDFKRLPGILEIVLAHEEDAGTRFSLQTELARLHVEKLRDDAGAVRWFGAALLEQPHRIDILDELEASGERAHVWSEVERLFDEARHPLSGDGSRLAEWFELTLRLGSILDRQLDRPEDALSCYDEVLARDPIHPVALDAKDNIFTRLGRWDDLLDVVVSKLDRETESGQRIALLERISVIHEDFRDDIASAIVSWREIMSLDQANLVALGALARLYRSTAEFEQLTDVLRELIVLHPRDQHAGRWTSLQVELAEVQVEPLEQFVDAVETLRQVVSFDSAHAGARALLESLLSSNEDQRLEVARILEPLYESEGQWARLVEVLEIELLSDHGVDEQVARLARIGDAQFSKLTNFEAATDACSRLLHVRASDTTARERLEWIAEQGGTWTELLALYESLIDEQSYQGAEGQAHAIAFAERASSFWDEKLSDVVEAIRLQRRILDMSPLRSVTLDKLDDLLTRAGAWEDLLSNCQERLQITDDAERRRAIHWQAAGIYEAHLGDLSSAIGEYEQVLAVSANDAQALESLDRLHGATEDAVSQASVIERRVAISEEGSDEQLVLLNRLAEVIEERIGDVPRAIAVVQRILTLAPENSAALHRLQEQLSNEDYASLAADILQPLYESQHHWVELVAVLEVRLQYATEVSARRSHFMRLAELHEQELGSSSAAYGVLERALGEFLSDADVLAGCYRLAGELGVFESLADRLEALADESSDSVEARNTLVRVAQLRDEQQGELEAAVQLWERVLDYDSLDAEALDALERLHGLRHAWAPLVEVLLRKAELPSALSDSGTRVGLLFRAASLYEEKLAQPTNAIEVLQQILQVEASNELAIAHLERLYTTTGAWEELVEIYHLKLRLISDPASQRELYATLGRVLETELDDADRAIAAYRSLLGLDAGDRVALRSLERLYTQTENWHELGEVLQTEAGLPGDPAETLALRNRVGRLYENELMNPTAAVETYRSIISDDVSNSEARNALFAMVQRGEEPRAGYGILEPIFRAEGVYDLLVDLDRMMVTVEDSPERRRALYVDIAEVCERSLGDGQGAWDAYADGLREVARLHEVVEVQRLAGSLGRWSQTVELFLELWDAQNDSVLRTELGLRVAEMYETHLQDVDKAVEAYVRVHDENPTEAKALAALDRLYVQTAQYTSLSEVLGKRISMAADLAQGVELRIRLARLYATELESPIEAISAWRELLAVDPRNDSALFALEAMATAGEETGEIAGILEPAFRQFGMWERLAGLYRARITNADGADERYRLWLELADVQETSLHNPSATLDAIGNALMEQPGDAGLKARIDELGELTGDWSRVVNILSAALASDASDADRFDLAMRLAAVLDVRLGDAEGAEEAYQQALQVDEASEAALRALDRLMTARAAWADLVGVLGRLRDVVYAAPELVALTFRQASIHEEKLGDLQAAIQTYQDVLDTDPMHAASLAALVRLHALTEDWKSLFDAYERQAEQASADTERSAVLEKMAVLATERLERVEDAIDLWRRVLDLRGGSDWNALQQLTALFRATEQHNDLVETLDRQIELAPDDAIRAQLLQESGYLWAEVLDNQDAAIDRYQRLLGLIEDEPSALTALRSLYDRTSQYEPFVKTVERMLELGLIPADEQAGVFEQVGTIYTDILNRHEKAVWAWNSLLSVQPGRLDALDRLDILHTQAREFEPLIAVLEQRLAILSDDVDRTDLLKRIAGIWLNELQNPANAADAYNRVLDIDLLDFDAGAAYEALLLQLERWDDLVALSLDRADALSDVWERRQEYMKAAQVAEQRQNKADSAFLLVQKASMESPADEELHAELERLAGVTNKHADLAETYRNLLTRMAADPSQDVKARLPLLLAIGAIQDGALRRPELAEPFYMQALDLDAENEKALTALESIYERTEDWEQLVWVLKRRATLAFDSREQAAHYLRIGTLYEGYLADLTEATEAYRMVVRLDDTDAGALAALERIYAAQSHWRELIEILELRAAVTYDPAPLSELRFRIAGLWHRQLANNDRAIEAYKDVLGIKPDDMPSLLALEELYGTLEKWDRYLDVLDQRLNLTSDTAERAAILFRTADVYETRFDDIDRAVDALNMVLSAMPSDLQAIESLERLFSDNQRFQELVDTYERHVNVVSDDETRAAVLAAMGRTIVEELQDVYRGVATYSRILEFDADNFVALERLGQLYEELGDARKAIEMYERLAEIAPSLARRAELLHRAGELYEGELGDSDTAEQRYRAVLRMDETFIPSMQALQRVYMGRESWLDAIEMIEAQIEYTRDLSHRSLLLVAIGQLNEDQMGNAPAAQRRFEEALEFDPTNVLAAEPLARMYFDDKKWERAKSCLDLLVGSDAYEKDDATLSVLYTQLGRVNEEMTLDDDAQRWYERTRSLQTGNPDALLGLARILRRLGRLQDAYALNLEVVNSYASSLSSAEKAALLFQCAEIMAELGQADESQALFEKVLEIDPRHMQSLKRLVAVVETTGDPRRIAEAKYRLQEVTEDPMARLSLLTQVGDAWMAAGELKSAERAYREAVRIDSESKAVLTKLLKVYLTDEQWEPACEVLGLLAKSESEPTRQAYFLFTIGTIFRDQLSNPSRALEFFNAALDRDPLYGDGGAFEAIDKLVTEARDWNTQEREYRRMLARIANLTTPQAETMKFVLAQALGEIYRSRIGDLDKAIDAFRLALSMQPDNEALMSSLAELYDRQGIQGPELVTLHQQILAVKPLRVDSYHTLYNAYRRNKDFDKAWCVSSVLTFVQRQTPEEDQYFKRYHTPQVPRAKRGVSDDLWNLLVHPDADPMISRIFGIIAPALREEYSNDLKRWNINKRRDKLELNQPMPLTTMLTYVFERLGVSPMAVYTTTAFDGLFNGNMEPPSLVAGGNLLQGRSERELAFICSKMVTTCRSEYYLGSAFNSTDALKIFFYAALALQTGQVVGDAPVETVREYVNALARLPEPRLVQLRNLVTAFINSGRNPDLSAWLRGVDHTANRVGLLLSGDVQVAADWTKNDMLAIGKEQPAERVRQLLKFSVSEDYFTLRRELGLALTA